MTSDGCTGVSVPPGGFCSIKVRFAPTVAGDRDSDAAAARQHGRGLAHRLPRAASAPRRRGRRRHGSAGAGRLAGRPDPPARRARRAPTARTARQARAGRPARTDDPGRPARGPAARRARPGRAARPAATPPYVQAEELRSGKVQVTCTVRFVSRARARACACGSCAGASSTRAPAARSGAAGSRCASIRPGAAAARALPAPAHLRRPQGPGDDRLAAGAAEPLGRGRGLGRQLPAGGVDVLPAREAHRRAEPVRLERGLERVDRAAAGPVVDRVRSGCTGSG